MRLRDQRMRHAAAAVAAAALRVAVLGLLVLGLALPPRAAGLRPLRERVASAGAAASSGSWADEVRRCWIARLASYPHFLYVRLLSQFAFRVEQSERAKCASILA
jgi:hypothetical protein